MTKEHSERLRSIFQRAGIATKNVEVLNGRSIIVTCHSRTMADLVHSALAQAGLGLRKAPVETIDYAVKNKGTCLKPTTVKVWRVGGRIS